MWSEGVGGAGLASQEGAGGFAAAPAAQGRQQRWRIPIRSQRSRQRQQASAKIYLSITAERLTKAYKKR